MKKEILVALVVGCCAAATGAVHAGVGAPPEATGPLSSPSELIESNKSMPLSDLVEAISSMNQIIPVYRSARTIGEIESANEQVRAMVAKAQAIASELNRLHLSVMQSCDLPVASQIEGIATKTGALSIILSQVDAEVSKSLVAMRQRTANDKPSVASTLAKEVVRRLELASDRLGSQRVQALEISKAVETTVANIGMTGRSCAPTLIPPLFAQGAVPVPKPSTGRLSQKREHALPPNSADGRRPMTIFPRRLQ